ncbi:unnamed protein product, partial [Scytosiphon promiscuus]
TLTDPHSHSLPKVFSDWVTQTVRLRRGQAYAELDWTVGPVPVGASSS